jgi:hypothetical protein
VSAVRACLLAAAALATAACGSLTAQDSPGVIVSPSAATRAELARVVSSAMNGQPVTLADDALTRESTLTIERRTPPGEQGRAATGRTVEEPVRFRLVVRENGCVLVREADGRAFPLEGVRCAPAAAAR